MKVARVVIGSSGLLKQLMRYGLVGVANTIVGFGAILILQMLFGLDPYSANAVGYAIGLATSFVLNRIWTFQVSDRPVGRLLRFVLAFAISYTANLGTLTLLLDSVGAVAAQAVAAIVYSTVFFVCCRAYVFARPHGQPV
ncbi:GtrA family protein [Rhizobium sp. P32RR-XVIII]|uniref:GtrA family protein n=1 Tax=Rhizobium sp. P32RR-XVIII TaxID=2726738 RepID=UPI001456E72A|nr:GtrA family protein [Rhizobium sp. P32RR-XVIII]NLS08331.1 GtrA family protein [Rhizobium sp. P32RR-XVIII]